MAEDLRLYWTLFQDKFPDEWRRDQDFLDYLSELGAYSVDKLQLEPEHLQEERRCVLNSTQRLAFNNYKTFIQTAECTREVFKDFVLVEEHVACLLDKIPSFVSASKDFAKESQEINAKRKLNSLALTRHGQLLEVLEIPQVMETCVRNGYYEEALDLSAHVRRLEKKHGTIPIIKTIARDVETSMDLMLSQLLQQLRSAIQLPACLRVVGFLRRMEVFSDAELRLKFLQARDTWLTSVLNNIPTEDPYHHITKTIEASRVHLFDIVTQYRAIFPDDDSFLASYTSSGKEGGRVEGALFYGWVNEKVWQFLHSLEADLTRGVGGRIDSLLGQCMYFGLSFSRIGTDFRALIVPVFTRVIANSFRHSIRNAKHSFHEAMKRLTLITPLHSLSSTSSFPPSSSASLSPPHSLLDYPPLAALTNTLIHAFNDLRQCAPIALGPTVSQELRRLLESVVHDVGEFHRVEHASFSDKEAEAFTQLCRVVIQDFLPFVGKCFESLFSYSTVEQLALTTPYALRHSKNKHKDGSVGGISSLRPSVELHMELDVTAIGEGLRGPAPHVFEELEKPTVMGGEGGSDGVSSLTVDIGSLLSQVPVDQPSLAEPASESETQDPIVTDSTSTAASLTTNTATADDREPTNEVQLDPPVGGLETNPFISTATHNGSSSASPPIVYPDPIIPHSEPNSLVPGRLVEQLSDTKHSSLPAAALGTWSTQFATS